jgi:predicted HAD superfamily Cof-like phosphohydrolase
MLGAEVAPELPVQISRYNGELRCSLIEEEAREFRTAWEAADQLSMVDALCDLLYVTLGAAVEMGVELEPFFDVVHKANMNKTGGPIREDGKKLKPDGWQPPDIHGVWQSMYAGPPRSLGIAGEFDPTVRP